MEDKKLMELNIKKYPISKENEKNPMKIINDPKPIDFVDLMEPEKERISSNNKEIEGSQRQMGYFKVKPRKKTRISNKALMNPYIKDLVINKEEYTIENEWGKQVNEEVIWGFHSTYDFSKTKNKKKKDWIQISRRYTSNYFDFVA